MQTKGKGSKVFVAARKSRSRLLTFPRGDLPKGLRHKARKGRRIWDLKWQCLFLTGAADP